GLRPAVLALDYDGPTLAGEYRFGGGVSVTGRSFEVMPYEGVQVIAGVTTRARVGVLLADRVLAPAQVAAAATVEILADVDDELGLYVRLGVTPSDEAGVYHLDAGLRYADAGEKTFRLRCTPTSRAFGLPSTA